MIGAIQANSQINQTPEIRKFDEGAGNTASKVGAFVLSLIAATASFVYLPAPAAFATTVGIAALFSLLFCCGSAPSPGAARGADAGQPVILPWYRRAWDVGPVWFRNRPAVQDRPVVFNNQPVGRYDAPVVQARPIVQAQPAVHAQPAARYEGLRPIIPGANPQVRVGGGHAPVNPFPPLDNPPVVQAQPAVHYDAPRAIVPGAQPQVRVGGGRAPVPPAVIHPQPQPPGGAQYSRVAYQGVAPAPVPAVNRGAPAPVVNSGQHVAVGHGRRH